MSADAAYPDTPCSNRAADKQRCKLVFLILPYSAELRLQRIPWVVLATVLLCFLIHSIQDSRRYALSEKLAGYCESIHNPESWHELADILTADPYECEAILSSLHDMPNQEAFDRIVHAWGQRTEDASEAELDKLIRSVRRHYESIRDEVPPSLDAQLTYDPLQLNPFRSILSALAHADWWHLIGNLVFFLAFAPALELVVANPLKFIGSLLAIEIACDTAYSVSVLLGADPFPTLGLSGVVMGMIGMAGYLIPRVRIRTFIWLAFYARTFYVPAAILAAWYVGWDSYYLISSDNASGINLLAHVVGGATGYLLARHWFRDLREESEEEINDEIEYLRSLRQDKLGVLSSYTSKTGWHQNQHRLRMLDKDFDDYLDRIASYVRCGKDSDAIVLLLERYDDYKLMIETYERLFEEIYAWRQTRTVLCLARLLINEYLRTGKYRKAIEVAQKAIQVTDQFVYAEPGQKDLVESLAKRNGILLGKSVPTDAAVSGLR